MPGMNSLDVSLWQPAARYPSTKSVTIRRLSKSSCCVFFRRRRLNRSARKVGHSTFYGKTGKRDKPPFLVPHQSERWSVRRVPKTGALHAICRAQWVDVWETALTFLKSRFFGDNSRFRRMARKDCARVASLNPLASKWRGPHLTRQQPFFQRVQLGRVHPGDRPLSSVLSSFRHPPPDTGGGK